MNKIWNYIFISLMILSVILIIFAIILGFIDYEISSCIGMISTIVSILLAIFSFVYTYISGKETLDNLDEIKRQNYILVQKINDELSKSNYNDNNIENITEMLINEMKE